MLADDIVTAIHAATWTTITEPFMTVREDKQAELTVGKGWVSSGKQVVNPNTLGTGNYGERETPFEIYIACSTDANYVLYQSNIETIVNAASITGGWWEITEYIMEPFRNRHDFHCTGREVKIG